MVAADEMAKTVFSFQSECTDLKKKVTTLESTLLENDCDIEDLNDTVKAKENTIQSLQKQLQELKKMNTKNKFTQGKYKM